VNNKKSAGLDNISPYLLKKCVPYMLKLLLELVSASIGEDIFPSSLDKLVLKQVYEKGIKKMQTFIIQLFWSQIFQRFW
jgi:hypothetical protein